MGWSARIFCHFPPGLLCLCSSKQLACHPKKFLIFPSLYFYFQLFFMILHSDMFEFYSVMQSFATCFTMLLGKFNFTIIEVNNLCFWFISILFNCRLWGISVSIFDGCHHVFYICHELNFYFIKCVADNCHWGIWKGL